MRILSSPRIMNPKGFSLVEMMIVLALIALASTFVLTNVTKRFTEGKISATKTQIRQLGTILDDFKRVCDFYPTTEQNLDALVKAPAGRECKNYDPDGFIKKVPEDPWGTPFIYESDGSKYVIKSLGSDKKPGGEKDAADISSDTLD
ncbi:type II secretion system major pseudopilin GspG [Bdellovibrionota bacterium FG-2]